MRYQRLTDNTSIVVGETGESQLLSSSLDTNRDVCRIREVILILLFIALSLYVFIFMMDARLLIKDKDDNYRQGTRFLVPIILSIIYYGCGLYVVYRYYHLGIYVFAWLGILQYLSLCAQVYLSIIFIIQHPSHDTQAKIGIHIGLTIVVVSTLQTILMVIILKLTFKLLHVIKTFKREVLEQM